ncbi:MAG: branched-chain amino acid ABC transporter permease [Anaerolineae bacterium]|nr:branched-chain amino acid ABC transporter permease [Anaerolineae bacterium]
MLGRPSGIFNVRYEQDSALYRTRVDWGWGLFVLGVLLALPLLTRQGLFGNDAPLSVALIGILTRAWITIIAVTGLNLLLGYTGQVSLGHAAFIMVGAYTSQALVDQLGLSFWLALPLAALLTGLVGVLFGLPALRVRGFYLAMTTLAAQFMIPWFITTYQGSWFEGLLWERAVPALCILGGLALGLRQATQQTANRGTLARAMQISLGVVAGVLLGLFISQLHRLDLGGATGKTVSPPTINLPGLVDWRLNTNLSMYYVALVSLIIMAGAARNLVRSHIGRALISVRDNELAAEQLGINVFRYKLLAFFLAAVYAGVAGSLQAHSAQSISPSAFDLERSILLVGMLIIGGVGFPLGPSFGVLFFVSMNDLIIPQVRPWLRDQLPNLVTFVDPANLDPALLPMLFGATLILFLIFEPRGLAYRWLLLQVAWRLRPFIRS